MHTTNKTRFCRLYAGAVVLAFPFAAVPGAWGQGLTPPHTSTTIAAPVGNTLFLVGHASGTQGYVCLPTAADPSVASWTVNNPRPEATLFQHVFGFDVQIITHFLSPDTNPNGVLKVLPFGSATWQSSFDSSKVWAAVLNGTTVPAGSEPACPNSGSIACLLLTSIGYQDGPTGGRILSKTSYVQRLNTNGGSAPDKGCSTSADVGKQSLVPYTADYYFYRPQN